MSNTSIFVCQQCGNEYSKWLGKCTACGAWNSLVETAQFTSKGKKGNKSTRSTNNIKTETVKLTDIKASEMQRITTGIAELDRALGGGLVNGQVVLIAGEPGIGKCVTGETYIPTENGLEKIKNIVPKKAKLGFSSYKIGVQSINGKEFTNQFYKSGLQPTKKIQTRMGYELQTTYEHPILTLSKQGTKKWKEMKELKNGDFVAIQRHGQIWGKNIKLPNFDFEIKTNAVVPKFPKIIDEKMSYCLGLLIGDGGLTDFGHVNLTTNDLFIKESFENWIQNLSLKVYHLPKSLRLSVNNHIFHRWLQNLGMKSVLSINKSVPDIILKSPKDIVRAFLQGLFDTDGSANTNLKGSMPGVVEFCTASKQLAKEVHLLLLQFGIIGNLRFKKNNKHGAWIIGLLGDSARLFYENIGFRLDRKQSAKKLLSDINNNNLDVIPYLPKLDFLKIPHEFRSDRRYLKGTRSPSYEKLKFLSEFIPELRNLIEPNFYWDEIKKVEDSDIVECFDLCVPSSHSFVTNGIVSHNSTVLIQLANKLKKTMYVSGEESSTQVAIRAERLGIKNKNIDFLESTDADDIIEQLSGVKDLDLIIIDSIQTISTLDLTGLAGSVGQVRECAFRLLKYAKSKNIPLILVGHVTKEGTVAGPAVLAHIVDTVLWFEGDKKTNLRLLRSVKNRFGATDEVGIFSMEDKGLVSLDNPEKLFLDTESSRVAGSVVSMLMEGSRSILVEIQSLVVPTKMAFPRRVAQGIDSKRLEMLLAVLFRRANVPMYDMDVFVNVAGGIKANDPSMDLAICLSVASSFYEKPLPKKFLALGEIGLSGEIRKVGFQEKREKDSKRLGFGDIASSTSFKYLSEVIKSYLK